MINPIDRIPAALQEVFDWWISFLIKKLWFFIIFFITALAILGFASTRDFIISCQPYSIDPGKHCPLK